MGQVIQDAIELVKHFEGFRSSPYKDVAGVWTIGYGTTRMGSSPIQESTPPLTESEAEAMLLAELSFCARRVATLTTVSLSERELGALASFSYNLGTGAYRASTLRRRVNDRDYDDIRPQFMRWVYAGGMVQPGLIRRRQAEADLFLL